jgi:hypothetical protein
MEAVGGWRSLEEGEGRKSAIAALAGRKFVEGDVSLSQLRYDTTF